MRSKMLLNLFAAALFVALSAAATSAQVVTASGNVLLKQADGTTVPLVGGLIKFYRTDISQEFSAKTDKRGTYVNVGLPLVGVYTITASGPGARPDYMTNVRISQRPENNFTLEPGDGNTLTLEQIKTARAAGPAAGPAAPAVNAAEAKKAAEERAKEIERVKNENAKAIELNAKLPEILKAGNTALDAKNYDEAINQFELGIQADPEQAIFYAYKASALRRRSVDRFNAAAKAKDQPGKEAARADFKAAVESSEKAVTAYRALKSKQGGNTAGGGQSADSSLGYLADRAESYRLALQTSAPIDNDAATKAIEEYIDAEPDVVKKDKAQSSLGDALFYAGRIDDAIAKFRAVLVKNPNNLDAMFGLGIALASKVVDTNKDAPIMIEARDTLQQFVSKAPEGYARKQEAIESVKYLDDTLKSASTKPPEVKGRVVGTKKKP